MSEMKELSSRLGGIAARGRSRDFALKRTQRAYRVSRVVIGIGINYIEIDGRN